VRVGLEEVSFVMVKQDGLGFWGWLREILAIFLPMDFRRIRNFV